MPNNVQIQFRPATALGIQSGVTCATSTALTVAAGATHCVIDNSSAVYIRYRIDGSAATSTAGNRLAPGASLTWTDPSADYSAWMAGFRMIQELSGGTVEVAYMTFLSNP